MNTSQKSGSVSSCLVSSASATLQFQRHFLLRQRISNLATMSFQVNRGKFNNRPGLWKSEVWSHSAMLSERAVYGLSNLIRNKSQLSDILLENTYVVISKQIQCCHWKLKKTWNLEDLGRSHYLGITKRCVSYYNQSWLRTVLQFLDGSTAQQYKVWRK